MITSDEWSAYPGAILEVFGGEVTPSRAGKPCGPAGLHGDVLRHGAQGAGGGGTSCA